jgi:hypothetical protein
MVRFSSYTSKECLLAITSLPDAISKRPCCFRSYAAVLRWTSADQPSGCRWNEGLHGIAGPYTNFSDQGQYSYSTSFPQPILMGAAFDDELITQVATVISTEARAFNNANRTGLDFWTPNINPFRDPRWGRVSITLFYYQDILANTQTVSGFLSQILVSGVFQERLLPEGLSSTSSHFSFVPSTNTLLTAV